MATFVVGRVLTCNMRLQRLQTGPYRHQGVSVC